MSVVIGQRDYNSQRILQITTNVMTSSKQKLASVGGIVGTFKMLMMSETIATLSRTVFTRISAAPE